MTMRSRDNETMGSYLFNCYNWYRVCPKYLCSRGDAMNNNILFGTIVCCIYYSENENKGLSTLAFSNWIKLDPPDGLIKY